MSKGTPVARWRYSSPNTDALRIVVGNCLQMHAPISQRKFSLNSVQGRKGGEGPLGTTMRGAGSPFEVRICYEAPIRFGALFFFHSTALPYVFCLCFEAVARGPEAQTPASRISCGVQIRHRCADELWTSPTLVSTSRNKNVANIPLDSRRVHQRDGDGWVGECTTGTLRWKRWCFLGGPICER